MLQDRFKSASAFMASARNLNLPSSTKLALYADYKIATEGLCTQPRPSLFEFEKSAKWKAWKETGDRYLKELAAAQSVSINDLEDTLQLTLSTKGMVSYMQRVEEGQWGWKFDPMESRDLTASTSTGDKDLDELEAYLGVDSEEISAEELMARPYVPMHGHIDGVILTAAGISTLNVPVEDDLGEDPFESAKTGSLESLRAALTANPALASRRDDMGYTILHWACDRGSLEKVRSLVEEYGADVNAQDAEGSTPLHCACFSGWPGIIEYLKNQPSVDQTIKDNSGMTAEECLE
ncbi:acyl-CoA binding domain-containing protein 6 [Modicella reniformis]|uniref:Acyl-CoA binding domain-containing protein 6 n=1 Tax=Modicella reniformis TaxID=1440133 RepID=A0A9P6IMJ8_9FUNG|nr:acyl-CoA binding domain-containing protein 6 [Modicella reniformis]